MKAPDETFIKEYQQWLRAQGKSERTVNQYSLALSKIPEDVEEFFVDQNQKCKKLKACAYHSFSRFLLVKKKFISHNEYLEIIETIKPPKKRGNHVSERKWSVPKEEWSDYIRRAPNQVAKMGMWIGFNFGLRLSKIVHLRVQDIKFSDDQRQNRILVREHLQTKHQKTWAPKHKRERQLPFTEKQAKTFKRWIDDVRPKELNHPYLL